MPALLAAVALALGPAASAESTAYCLSGTMADSTGVRAGSVAHNGYELGTRLSDRPSAGPGQIRQRAHDRDRRNRAATGQTRS
jgi:hypothetical protein